jgi:CRISPR-associated protein Csx17
MALNDGSIEFRLALALGSAASAYLKTGQAIDPVRNHWLPLDRGQRRFKTSDKRIAHDMRVVMHGRDLLHDCAALVERRLIEAQQHGNRHLRLVAARGCAARLSDVAALLNDNLDLMKLHELSLGLMAIDWNRWLPEMNSSRHFGGPLPHDAWLMLRVASLPWALKPNLRIPTDPRLIQRLKSGDSITAVRIARHRLQSAGIRPPLQITFTASKTARLWCAALVFPIDHGSAWSAVTTLDPTMKGSLDA